MRASLMRTGSVPVQNPVDPGSPRFSLSRQPSLAGGDHNRFQSPRLSLHFRSNGRRDTPPNGIHRALSESSAIRSASEGFGVRRNPDLRGTRSFPASVRDDEEEEFGDGSGGGDGGIATVTGGNGGERIKIGAYYEELLKSNPTDALLLRNYGKFLHEVEKDAARAEEYYGRAILANPGDGEVLSLYGTLIWETDRDEERAKSYFDQAVHAAPDDCTVLGSYAHFMWEAEEEEEEEEEVDGGGMRGEAEESAAELIAAF